MFSFRAGGAGHCYLDEGVDGFSNLAAGLFVRALGHGLRVAYVDCCAKAGKFVNFLENLSLSYSFVRRFSRFNADIFTFRGNGKVEKVILPLVEFSNVPEDFLWNSLDDYDVVIFDGVDFESFDKFKIISLLERAKERGKDFVFVFSKEEDFEKVVSYSDLASKFVFSKGGGLVSKDCVNGVFGEGRGISRYGFGVVLRRFIEKQDVKLIGFDKGDWGEGERRFFFALKRWALENSFYGRFDFVFTGVKRWESGKFREASSEADLREANDAFEILKSCVRKGEVVVADGFLTAIKRGLLRKDEVESVFNCVGGEFLFTGEMFEEFSSFCGGFLLVEKVGKNSVGMKFGVDL